MKKILNFIQNGKGWGLKYLFCFALLFVGGFGLFVLPNFKFQTMNVLNAIVNSVSVIEIQDGDVVQPLNTKQTVYYQNSPILYIDTTVEDLNTSDLENGIYLSRENLYIVSSTNQQKMVNVTELEGNLTISQKTLPELSEKMNYMMYGVIIPMIVLSSFVFLIVKIFILTLISYILTFISNQKLSFAGRMRLNAVIFLSLVLIYVLLNSVGIVLNLTSFFGISVILQCIYFLRQDFLGKA